MGWGMALGALGGIGGGLYGGKMDRKAQKRAQGVNQKARAAALDWYKQERDRLYGHGDEAIAAMLQAWRGAMGQIDQVGKSSRQDILSQGKQAGADATAHMMNTGLYNTTRGGQAQAQAGYQTGRNLGSLAEMMAGLRANTMLQGAGGYANALRGQQNFRGRIFETMLPWKGMSKNAGIQYPSQARAWGAAGAGLGGLAGQIPWGDLFSGGGFWNSRTWDKAGGDYNMGSGGLDI